MAQPIEFVYKAQDHTAGSREQMDRVLRNLPAEHYDAVLELFSTLQAAHDNHVLEIVRGALTATEHIARELAEAAKSEGGIRGLRNLIMLAEILGSIDPEALHAVVRSLPVAVTEASAAARSHRTPSVRQLTGSFTSAESRRALGMVAAVLTSIGKGMGSHQKHEK